MRSRSALLKSVILIITISPLFTGDIVRTYAWLIVLGKNGFINSVLRDLGVIAQPLDLLYTPAGVVIALVQYSMPVMVIILAAAISHIDVDYERAATSLGASPLNVFLRVTLPLSAPGIISGFITIFAWTLSAFATPQLVGGGKVNMISNMVYNMGFSNFDFPVRRRAQHDGAAADHGAARADPPLGPALRADRAALMKRVDATPLWKLVWGAGSRP